MSRKEFLAWMDFYRLYPFDDLHRYHRPAALISTSMTGGDVRDRLSWLFPLPEDPEQGVDFFSLMNS